MDSMVRVFVPDDVARGEPTFALALPSEPMCLAVASGGGLSAAASGGIDQQVLLIGLLDGAIELRSPHKGFALRARLANAAPLFVGHAETVRRRGRVPLVAACGRSRAERARV